jgi:hypothetical protein
LVACEFPDTSGQRGPVVSAYTGTDGSASNLANPAAVTLALKPVARESVR